MNKKFSFKIWKDILLDIYIKTGSRRFFDYVDLIQLFFDDKCIFLLVPNIKVKLIIEKYYYGSIINGIKSRFGRIYETKIILGVIYMDYETRFCIKKNCFKIINSSDINEIFFYIKHFLFKDKFFLYIYSEKIISINDFNKLSLYIKNLGMNGIKTSIRYLLKNFDNVKFYNKKYKLFLFYEKKYDYDFFISLKRYIIKVKPFVENSNVIFLSNSKFKDIEEYMFNFYD